MQLSNIAQQQERLNPSNTKDGFLESVIVVTAQGITNAQGHRQKLVDIFHLIRTSPILRDKIELLRSTQGEKEQDAIKKSLQWFSLGEYRNNHRSNEDLISIRYLIHDLDYLKVDPQVLRAEIQKDPNVLAVYVSPRGNGLKVICELEQPITDIEEFRQVYKHHAKEFEKTYRITLDPNGEKATQACYYSYDPDLYVNPNNLKLPIIADSPESEEKPKKIPVIEAALQGSEPGFRTEGVTRQVGLYMSKGFSKEMTLTHVSEWNRRSNPPLEESKIQSTVEDMYKRYDKLPVKYIEKDGSYFKHVTQGDKAKLSQLTTFTIQPEELLILPNSDCLRCKVTTNAGVIYNNILIENSDWHSRGKFLKAIGHQDCSFIGSDNEIQGLCSYVNSKVTIRKKGSKTIGLIDNLWITKDSNISASGPMDPLSIVPYDKGSDAFYNQIQYAHSTPDENRVLVSGLCDTLFNINTPEVVVPILGWMFAAPVKPVVMNKTGAFPILFLHGGQGSGKTTIARTFMRLHGYKDANPKRCSMKPFPLLKLLSSTNAIPIVLDEFKVADMKEDIVDSLLRTLREAYNGEVETKGHQDQTVQDYKLEAPIVLAGEWSISQPAIKERVILVRFSDAVKKNKAMQEAFERLWDLDLESFIPAYICFCLNQDINALYARVKSEVENHFISKTVAPRIIHNLSVMVLGLVLFQGYAASLGLRVPVIALDTILDSQLEEITGNKSGFVKSAVDQMIEELGAMAQKNEKERNPANPNEPLLKDVPWFKNVKVDGVDAIAINFTRIFPEFKEHCRRTKYEGDLLDKESYLKLFDECSYVADKSRSVKYGNKTVRSLCINIERAKEAELNLDGFGLN